MGGMRTFVLLFLGWCISAPAWGLPADQQLRSFANCAGRLTAELEHAWLTYDDRADVIEAQRKQVVELLNAVLPQNRGREVLAWRVEARAAQRALLMRATFADNSDDAAWAAKVASEYRADCTSFLLS